MDFGTLESFSKWFWNEDIWLPPNTTWADRIATPENNLPNFMDLWTYPFVIAVVFIIIRYGILNPFVFSPTALYFGLKNVKPRNVIPNDVMETVFRKYKKKVPEEVIASSAKKLSWSERKVERWLRARAGMNRMNTHTKFTECAWQFVYYFFIFIYGAYVLFDEPWLYDVNHCWIGYPNFIVTNGIWWYYMLSLGFYWSMTITHFLETRRKDFYQMFFHHVLTILLLVFSYTCNFTRIGSLIVLVHDVADIPLQISKILIYLEWKKLCDAVFAFFAILWIITRCGIYPFVIVYNVLFDATDFVPMHPVYYIFSSLLTSLAVLHFYWTYFILRIIVNSAVKGKVEDERSSSEEEPVGKESFGDDVLKKD